MLISHQSRCIFAHVPKCAGSSIKKILELDCIIPPYWHCSWEEAREILGEEILHTYFKFAIVRNPWDRVISAWQMFEQKPWCYHQNYSLKEFLKIVRDESINYIAHYKNLLEMKLWEKSPENIRHHTLPCLHPYYGLVDRSGQIQVDFIGRFETLDRDFQKICQHLNIPALSLPKNNATEHHHYSQYYDNELSQCVSDYYQADIKTFQYQF